MTGTATWSTPYIPHLHVPGGHCVQIWTYSTKLACGTPFSWRVNPLAQLSECPKKFTPCISPFINSVKGIRTQFSSLSTLCLMIGWSGITVHNYIVLICHAHNGFFNSDLSGFLSWYCPWKTPYGNYRLRRFALNKALYTQSPVVCTLRRSWPLDHSHTCLADSRTAQECRVPRHSSEIEYTGVLP